MKLYVFLGYKDYQDNSGEYIIEQVRAENHDEAVAKAVSPLVNGSTDFYSTDAA